MFWKSSLLHLKMARGIVGTLLDGIIEPCCTRRRSDSHIGFGRALLGLTKRIKPVRKQVGGYRNDVG